VFLSWIIPCYNEERRIEKTLREVDAYLRSKNFPGGHEIIVVDSASRDRTAQIVKILAQVIPSLRLIELENKGKGWAVRSGMLAAEGEIRLFSDADNATSPDHFDKIAPLFEKGYEVVISSRSPRDAPGTSQEIPESLTRRLAGRLGNLIIQFFAVRGIWDTQNGFKAFRALIAKDLFSRQRMAGFSFDIELLALAQRRGYKIGIIPVKWRHDPESKVTLSSYLRVLLDVVRIWWGMATNTYGL